ncbi:MAG: hypothetical protein JRE12_10685, partial [Deltaproteobacteria bacterium]|nr:hypothetical protein [Deltaproteobacteria bacterium]
NTKGYSGRTLKKNIVVSTNDPKSPSITLSISGMVEKFVDIKPAYARLSGNAGQKISTLISIVPAKKYSFKITGISAMQDRDIQYFLTEKKFPEGDGYELVVENRKTDKGSYHDVLSMKTDSSIQPVIKISVYGKIHDPDPDQKNSDRIAE